MKKKKNLKKPPQTKNKIEPKKSIGARKQKTITEPPVVSASIPSSSSTGSSIFKILKAIFLPKGGWLFAWILGLSKFGYLLYFGFLFCAFLFGDGQYLFIKEKMPLEGTGLSALAVILAIILGFIRNWKPTQKTIVLENKSSLKIAIPTSAIVPPIIFSEPIPVFGGWNIFWISIAYFIYTAILFWRPLTHLNDVVGFGDMAQYHFPSKYLWVQGLKTGNPFLWNPYSSLGGPFLANPNIFAYTPFNLLFLILPVSYAFTWTFFFHFLLSALGTYLFVRSLGAGWKGAFLSGMAYSFSSFFVAHLQAGHPTVIWTASWIPLSLFFLSLFLERQQSRFLFAAAGATSLGILEGHPQISMYSFLICGFYMVWYWLRGKLSGKKIILSIFGFFIFSLILAACQLVPTTEFAKLSDRWTWSYSNIMCDYTSPENLIYFLKPFYRGSPLNGTYSGPWGYHELATYIGLVPIFLAVVGLVFLKRRPVIGCFWFLSALFTVLSMGDSTSFSHHVFKFFYDFVPGFGHNRSVGRIMILTLFCLACVAGLALDEWSKFWKNKNLQSVGTRFLLITGIPLLLIVVTMADLWNYDRGFIQIESGDDFFSKTLIFPADMTELIQGDKSYPRVQPGSQNSSEHILKIYQLETSTMFTMMIKEVSQYIVAVENHYDSPLSDLIALKYVYYPDLFQHPTDRWKPFKYGAVINSKMLPHAYVVGGYDMVPNPTQAIELIQDNHFDIRTGVLLEKRPADDVAWNKGWMGEAIITHYGENEVDFTCQTDRRGIFFFSDPYYPGWKAWVDGKEKHIFRADGVFRAVVIDGPGNHQIRMSFQPLSVYLPFVFSIFAWFLLMLGFLFPKKSAELFKVMIQWMGPKT